MKTIRHALAICCLCYFGAFGTFGAISAYAKPLASDGVRKSDKPLGFFLHTGAQQYSYAEFKPHDEGGEKLMEISGILWGVNTGVVLRHAFAEQTLRFSYFSSINTAYDGQTQDFQPVAKPSSDYYLLGEYHLSPYIVRSTYFTLQGDLGLGYRYLHNQVEDSYRRSQHFLYFSAGLNAEQRILESLSLFAKLHMLGLVQGWHSSFLTDINYDRDLFLTQAYGKGYRVELGLRQFIYSSFALELSAYYEFWGIGDSNMLSATPNTTPNGQNGARPFVEPRNFTNTYGLQLGLSF